MKSHIIQDNAVMEFSHPREYIEQCIRSSSRTRSSHRSSEDFTGTKTFEEATDVATNGWSPEKMQGLAKNIIGRANGVKMRRVFADTSGKLSIDRYTMGLPKTLKSWKRKSEKSKRVTLAINIGENAGVETNIFFNKAAMLSAIAELCAKSNIQTEIIWVQSANVKGYFPNLDKGLSFYTCLVPLKRFNERLQVHKLGGMMHPSSFRRLWFGLAENRDQSYDYYRWGWVDDGYGKSTRQADLAGIHAIKEIYGRTNVIHIPSASDLELYTIDDCVKSAQKILDQVNEIL